jgi:translation initiation factor IF-3
VRENVNEAIRFREVRAVFPDGSNTVMSTSAAITRAKDMGLDLIVIAPTAQPPVAKAMDYGQWQYEEKKKRNEAKKKQHVIQVKEVKFRPNTDDHDYDFKRKHAERFLGEGNRVKAVVQFRGREIAHTDLGRRLLERLAKDVKEIGQVEGVIRMEGRTALMILSPVKTEKPKAEKPKADSAKPAGGATPPPAQ